MFGEIAPKVKNWLKPGDTFNYNQNTSTLSSPILKIGPSQTETSTARIYVSGVDSNANGPHQAYFTAADQYPLLQFLSWSHNNVNILFDSYYDGSNFKSSFSGSNFKITKISNMLNFDYASGVTAGSNITWATGSSLDTSGNWTVTNNVILSTAGGALKIKQGSNASAGTGATMSGGAVTVSTTAVSTGDVVLVTKTASGGTLGVGMPVVTISNGVSFTLTSSNALETSTFSWAIIKAA
jgi:hypothetical protein